MNFDQFQIPPFLIRELYKDVLTDLNSSGTQMKTRSLHDYTLGENTKHILILIKDQQSDIIDEKSLSFLSGILKACNLKVNEVAVLNILTSGVNDYKILAETFSPVTVLMFGVDPAFISLPVVFPEFQIQPFSNIRFLAAPSLSVLEGDKTLKARLWTCLQKLFL